MKKLMKYLSRSIPAILVIIVLLVVQANCDIALPTYISDIVNVGIQQGGVDSIVPTEIRISEMDKLSLFMKKEDFTTVKDFYETSEEKYILKESITDEQKNQLTEIFGKPMVIVNLLESSDNEQVNKITNGLKAQIPPEYANENAGFFELIELLPAHAQEQVMVQINEGMQEVNDLDESIIDQMAIFYVRSEYEALGMDTDQIQSDYIMQKGIQMVFLALGIALTAVIVSLLASRVGAKIGKDMRGDVFKKVVNFSNAEYNSFSTASLITRCTNDIQQIQMLVIMVLRMLIYAPILGIGALTKVVGTGGNMTWVIGVSVGVILVFVILLYILAMPRFKILQKLVDKLNLVSREIITGLPVIRAFGREKYEEKRFDNANNDLTKVNLFVNKIMSFMMPVMMFVMNATSVLIVWVGADQIAGGSMQVGSLMAFIQYTMQIIMAFLMISMISVMLPRAVISANRVQEVLNKEVSVKEPEAPKKIENKKGYVEFKNVSFAYPGAKNRVIKHINFTSKPGETTAIIGSTGCGKSTLLNLIPRFYDVTKGEILIDGVNIKDLTKEDLRDQIGYVPQKGLLFSGTIKSNIAYGLDDENEEAVKKAAKIAQSEDFIEAKSLKYDSEISQGGTNVSGGQRQRLSIARAIAKDPQIYLFDDSFSALDYKTDSALRKALKEETQNKTIIIVAQRISTVLTAEKIVVLDGGEIAGVGTHKELLQNCEVYQQIAQSQLSKEELENG